jgi:signal transduction histidine kinase
VAEVTPLGLDPLGPAQLVAIADEMASLLRHELRNKFASVRSAGFYVRRRLRETEAWQADPRLDELSGIIQDEMRLANELLDQRLRLQHLFAAAPARVDAADCVRLAASSVRGLGNGAVALEVEARSGSVMADPNELALAVRCLVENAVEATGNNGTVRVRAWPGAARYTIAIEDAGSGIEESRRSLVLQPFYTTKPGHAGLGLNIAQRIAERYGGSLVFSQVSAGTTTVLELATASTEPST